MYATAILFAGLLRSVVAADGEPLPPSPTQVQETAPKPWYDPFGLAVSLESQVGIGTFVADANADNPYWASTLAFAPSWSFSDKLQLRALFWMTYEWTYLVTGCSAPDGPRPDGAPAQDCSDTDDGSARRFDVNDLQLELDVGAFELGTIDFSGWTALSFPTSRYSRAVSNILTLSAGGNVARSFGFFRPNLNLSFAKFFPTENAPSLDADDADGAIPIARCPTGQPVNCISLSGFVPDWRLRTGLGANFKVPPLPGLTFDIELGYVYTRSYARAADEFSSQASDSNGDLIVDGRNENDQTFGTISASYAPTQAWSFSLGVSSAQPVKTADGTSVRFPFYDFVSPANNYTSWFFSVMYIL